MTPIVPGTGVPAVAHALLNALPEDVWQRDREKYIYETWVKSAQAKLQKARDRYAREKKAEKKEAEKQAEEQSKAL